MEEETNNEEKKKPNKQRKGGVCVCVCERVNSQHLQTAVPALHKVIYINHSPYLLSGHVSVHKSNAVLPKG